MSAAGHVVVVGTLNVDHVWQVSGLPQPGQTVLASAVERQFGGKGANQAVAAARQGARVKFFGAVGDDADGHAYRAHLAREGIDCEQVRVAPEAATGTAHVYVDARGENLIVVDRGANAHLDVRALRDGLGADDTLLVQLECPLPVVVEALRSAAARRARTILNAAPACAGFPWGELAIDVVIVNEHECAAGFGASPAEIRALSAAARGALLASRQIQHLVITQGAAPTLHLARDERHEVAALRLQPRDTVGAGDTFAGALAAELAVGRRWPEALRYANAAAGLSTLALGAQAAMPRRAQVEAAVAQCPATG